MSERWRNQGPKLEAPELGQLLQMFRQEAGLEFPQDTEFVMERKLRDRLAALNLDSFSAYVQFLRSGPAGRRELEGALEEVTTHETYFFREDFQLRAFRDELLPRLRAMTEGRKRLTLWSAGCATGEEVYTLAMLVDESKLFEGWTIRILGSDLSRRCIATARRGVYSGASFRAVPREYVDRYFIDDEDGSARVNDHLRRNTIFLQANLLEPERHLAVGRAEAIFCRNVLIYLAEEARQRVLQSLYDRLCPGGYLMLGHAESLLHVDSVFEPVHLQNDVVYRRPERDRRGTDGRAR